MNSSLELEIYKFIDVFNSSQPGEVIINYTEKDPLYPQILSHVTLQKTIMILSIDASVCKIQSHQYPRESKFDSDVLLQRQLPHCTTFLSWDTKIRHVDGLGSLNVPDVNCLTFYEYLMLLATKKSISKDWNKIVNTYLTCLIELYKTGVELIHLQFLHSSYLDVFSSLPSSKYTFTKTHFVRGTLQLTSSLPQIVFNTPSSGYSQTSMSGGTSTTKIHTQTPTSTNPTTGETSKTKIHSPTPNTIHLSSHIISDGPQNTINSQGLLTPVSFLGFNRESDSFSSNTERTKLNIPLQQQSDNVKVVLTQLNNRIDELFETSNHMAKEKLERSSDNKNNANVTLDELSNDPDYSPKLERNIVNNIKMVIKSYSTEQNVYILNLLKVFLYVVDQIKIWFNMVDTMQDYTPQFNSFPVIITLIVEHFSKEEGYIFFTHAMVTDYSTYDSLNNLELTYIQQQNDVRDINFVIERLFYVCGVYVNLKDLTEAKRKWQDLVDNVFSFIQQYAIHYILLTYCVYVKLKGISNLVNTIIPVGYNNQMFFGVWVNSVNQVYVDAKRYFDKVVNMINKWYGAAYKLHSTLRKALERLDTYNTRTRTMYSLVKQGTDEEEKYIQLFKLLLKKEEVNLFISYFTETLGYDTINCVPMYSQLKNVIFDIYNTSLRIKNLYEDNWIRNYCEHFTINALPSLDAVRDVLLGDIHHTLVDFMDDTILKNPITYGYLFMDTSRGDFGQTRSMNMENKRPMMKTQFIQGPEIGAAVQKLTEFNRQISSGSNLQQADTPNPDPYNVLHVTDPGQKNYFLSQSRDDRDIAKSFLKSSPLSSNSFSTMLGQNTPSTTKIQSQSASWTTLHSYPNFNPKRSYSLSSDPMHLINSFVRAPLNLDDDGFVNPVILEKENKRDSVSNTSTDVYHPSLTFAKTSGEQNNPSLIPFQKSQVPRRPAPLPPSHVQQTNSVQNPLQPTDNVPPPPETDRPQGFVNSMSEKQNSPLIPPPSSSPDYFVNYSSYSSPPTNTLITGGNNQSNRFVSHGDFTPIQSISSNSSNFLDSNNVQPITPSSSSIVQQWTSTNSQDPLDTFMNPFSEGVLDQSNSSNAMMTNRFMKSTYEVLKSEKQDDVHKSPGKGNYNLPSITLNEKNFSSFAGHVRGDEFDTKNNQKIININSAASEDDDNVAYERRLINKRPSGGFNPKTPQGGFKTTQPNNMSPLIQPKGNLQFNPNVLGESKKRSYNETNLSTNTLQANYKNLGPPSVPRGEKNPETTSQPLIQNQPTRSQSQVGFTMNPHPTFNLETITNSRVKIEQNMAKVIAPITNNEDPLGIHEVHMKTSEIQPLQNLDYLSKQVGSGPKINYASKDEYLSQLDLNLSQSKSGNRNPPINMSGAFGNFINTVVDAKPPIYPLNVAPLMPPEPITLEKPPSNPNLLPQNVGGNQKKPPSPPPPRSTGGSGQPNPPPVQPPPSNTVNSSLMSTIPFNTSNLDEGFLNSTVELPEIFGQRVPLVNQQIPKSPPIEFHESQEETFSSKSLPDSIHNIRAENTVNTPNIPDEYKTTNCLGQILDVFDLSKNVFTMKPEWIKLYNQGNISSKLDVLLEAFAASDSSFIFCEMDIQKLNFGMLRIYELVVLHAMSRLYTNDKGTKLSLDGMRIVRVLNEHKDILINQPVLEWNVWRFYWTGWNKRFIEMYLWFADVAGPGGNTFMPQWNAHRLIILKYDKIVLILKNHLLPIGKEMFKFVCQKEMVKNDLDKLNKINFLLPNNVREFNTLIQKVHIPTPSTVINNPPVMDTPLKIAYRLQDGANKNDWNTFLLKYRSILFSFTSIEECNKGAVSWLSAYTKKKPDEGKILYNLYRNFILDMLTSGYILQYTGGERMKQNVSHINGIEFYGDLSEQTIIRCFILFPCDNFGTLSSYLLQYAVHCALSLYFFIDTFKNDKEPLLITSMNLVDKIRGRIDNNARKPPAGNFVDNVTDDLSITKWMNTCLAPYYNTKFMYIPPSVGKRILEAVMMSSYCWMPLKFTNFVYLRPPLNVQPKSNLTCEDLIQQIQRIIQLNNNEPSSKVINATIERMSTYFIDVQGRCYAWIINVFEFYALCMQLFKPPQQE